MNLKVFTSKLKTERFGKNITKDLSFETLSEDKVRDTYDLYWGPDFVQDDPSEALTHAKQELEKADSHKGRTQEIHLRRACKDFNNYFAAVNYLAIEYENDPIDLINPARHDKEMEVWDRDAVKLIKAIASFGNGKIDKIFTDYILEYYQKCDSDYKNDLPGGFFPGYYHTYEKIGDEALFCDGDMNRALKWYRLMALDWFDILGESDLKPKEKKLAKRIIDWNNMLKSIECFAELSEDDVLHTLIVDIENLLDISDECKEVLRNYLNAWSNDNKDAIWEAATQFHCLVEADLSTAGKDRLRTEIILAYLMKEQATYYGLLIISESEDCIEWGKNISSANSDDADGLSENAGIMLSAILSCNAKKLNPVKGYVRNSKSNSAGVSDRLRVINVLRLVKAISTTEIVLNILNTGVFTGRVGYYTSLGALSYMLPESAESDDNIGKLSVMHVAYMNDPNEGKILEDAVFGNKNRPDNGRSRANYPYVFLKCFTTRIDDLPMWEVYGDHAQGCCLVLDMKKIMERNKKFFPVYNVCYLRKNKDEFEVLQDDNVGIRPDGIKLIKDAIDKLKAIAESGKSDKDFEEPFRRIMGSITYLFKNSDYAYECEKRIFYTFTSGDDKAIRHTNQEPPRLYVLSEMDIRIEEIILGPKFQNAYEQIPYLQERLDKMCIGLGEDSMIGISYSAIEYK